VHSPFAVSSALRFVAVNRSVLQCVAVCCIFEKWKHTLVPWYSVCCSVLKCAAVDYSEVQCVAVCCSKLQCVAVSHIFKRYQRTLVSWYSVCCSLLQ